LEKALLATKGDSQVEEVLKKHCVEDKSEFVLAKNMEQINRCFTANTVEEIMTNLEKDGSDFAKNALKLLAKMSPTSLKVTKLQLDLGEKMTLEECLKMEFRLAVNHCIKSDFKEGVRALLIDRDQNPQWNPKTLAEVSQAHVESFFRPLANNDELKFKL
jgi:3-hydroxyisobutyryl-CoA hydrolase